MNLAFEPSAESGKAIDPVCGMTVDMADARSRNLYLIKDNVEYYFCGKGCKLSFEEDPGSYLDSAYVPSM